MAERDISKLTIAELKAYAATLDKESRAEIEREISRLVKGISDDSYVRSLLAGNAYMALPVSELRKLNRVVSKRLDEFYDKVYVITNTSSSEAWRAGEQLQSKVARRKLPVKLYDALNERSVFVHRKQAMEMHQLSRPAFNKSARIWKAGASDQIDTAIQLALANGDSADKLARDLRQYLREPERIYKRVEIYKRNAEGDKIIGSDGKPVRAVEIRRRVLDERTGKFRWIGEEDPYRPGRGVARSARANAMRMARNEIVKAYRASQLVQLRANPTAIGYRIILSNNHTHLNAKGQAIPYTAADDEICDSGKGEYPLDWSWDGWHVNCRCIIIALFVPEKIIKQMAKAYAKGEDWNYDLNSYMINELPVSLIGWVGRHAEQMLGWKHLPEWVIKNEKYRLVLNI